MTYIMARRVALLNRPMMYNRKVELDKGSSNSGTIVHKGKNIRVRKVGDTWRQTSRQT